MIFEQAALIAEATLVPGQAATFASETVTVDNVINDLGKLFGISRDIAKYEMLTADAKQRSRLYLGNFALDHQRKKQFWLAEEFFQKSFDQNTPVYLLEYHYGDCSCIP